jgi:hypothetical protein
MVWWSIDKYGRSDRALAWVRGLTWLLPGNTPAAKVEFFALTVVWECFM